MDTFEDFYKYLVHPQYDRCYRAHAVVVWSVNGVLMQTLIHQNIPRPQRQHVVHVILKRLNEEIEAKKSEIQGELKLDVKLYMNYSPCNDRGNPSEGDLTCCEALIDFRRRQDIKVTLGVVFVSLYMILRTSCRQRCQPGSPHLNINASRSRQNTQGLRNLRDARIVLSTFSNESWLLLRTELNIDVNDEAYIHLLEEISAEDRSREDLLMQQDLDQILGGGAGQGGGAPGPGPGPGDDDDDDPKQAMAISAEPKHGDDDPKGTAVEQEKAAAARKLRELESLPETVQGMSISSRKADTKPEKDTK